jgi:BlaI family transcriptional regulator, penicillinase repressor
MSGIKYLSGLQMAVMRVLWKLGEAAVTQVQAALQGERDLAPTTIATVLSRLEESGLVAHRTEERRYVYRAMVTESQVRRSMVADLVDRLFQGDPSAMIDHLINESDVSADDLAHIQALLKAKENDDKQGVKKANDAR